jgi:hypothetical protein
MNERRRQKRAAPWTSPEDDLLRTMALTGESPINIGLRLKRSESGVRMRAFRLRIPLKVIDKRRGL